MKKALIILLLFIGLMSTSTIAQNGGLHITSGGVDQPSGHNICDGGVHFAVDGGTAPYLYTLYSTNTGTTLPWQTTPCFTGLCEGWYSVMIMESDFTLSSYPAWEIENPDPILILHSGAVITTSSNFTSSQLTSSGSEKVTGSDMFGSNAGKH